MLTDITQIPVLFGKRFFLVYFPARVCLTSKRRLGPLFFSKPKALNRHHFLEYVYTVNLVPNQICYFEKKSGWRLLFDGKTNSGWRSAKGKSFPEKGGDIKDGVISVLENDGRESTNGGDIVTNEKFSAFDLSFEI